MKRSIGLIVSFGISGALVYLLFRDIDRESFLRELGRVRLSYLPLLIVLIVLPFWIRALRWRYILPNTAELSVSKLYSATAIGFFSSFILPLRAGEIIRPWALSKVERVSFSAGLASIVTERIFDIVALFTLLGLCMTQVETAPTLVVVGAQLLGGMAGAIIVVMIVAYFRGELVISLSQRMIAALLSKSAPGLAEKLSSMAREFVTALRALESFRELLIALSLSYLLWGEVTVLYQVGLWSVGDFPTFWVGAMVNVMIALAVAAPSAPGFVGTFQAGCSVALVTCYGYSEAFAMSYSILMHVFQLAIVALLGLHALHREKLGFREMLRHQEP